MRKAMSELEDLFRAKTKCIWINSYEENEVIMDIAKIVSKSRKSMEMNIWSHTEGMTRYPLSELELKPETDQSMAQPQALFKEIKRVQEGKSNQKSTVYVLRDFHHLNSMHAVNRGLRDIAETNSENYAPIIVVSPITDIPIEHEKLFTIIDYNLPDEEDVTNIIHSIALKIHKTPNKGITPPTIKEKEELVRACLGLTFREITDICTMSIIRHRELSVEEVLKQKMDLVKKSGVLEYSVPTVDLDDIGGNENYKEWIDTVKDSYTEEAIEFGVPLPKGVLHLGVAGTSKTLMAEALSSEMKIPLIKFQIDQVMDRFVGNSEKKVDQALRLIESVAPCVLLIDEVEKVLGGISSSNSVDGGTLSRVFSRILQFMNDNKSGVFVVMTSNGVSQLPPELTRSGRLDAHWYFGLPTDKERKEILKIHLRKFNKELDEKDIEDVVSKTPNFTGAEIENVVREGVRNAFNRYKEDGNKEVLVEDFTKAASQVVPLYKSSKEKVLTLETWAKDRARSTSKSESDSYNPDLDASLLEEITSIKL